MFYHRASLPDRIKRLEQAARDIKPVDIDHETPVQEIESAQKDLDNDMTLFFTAQLEAGKKKLAGEPTTSQ